LRRGASLAALRAVPSRAFKIMAAFALQIVDIDESGKDYAFPLKREWLDPALVDAGLRANPGQQPPGSLEVHAQLNGGAEYLVEGRLQAELVTDCVRCLGVANVPVNSRFATLFTRKSAPRGERATPTLELSHEDAEDDDLQHEDFSGHQIVLDDLVREYLVLEVPMQPLCSPDCQGIAVPEHVRPPAETFGTSDAPVDPRLAPLLRLRDKVPPKPNKE
jgi:uncharacterized metal-binding protein YceD (DUF177 family)